MPESDLELDDAALTVLAAASVPPVVKATQVTPGPSFLEPSDQGVSLSAEPSSATAPTPLIPPPNMTQDAAVPTPTIASRPKHSRKPASNISVRLPLGQLVLERLRSRRVRVLLTLGCVIAVTTLLGLNLMGKRNPALTDEDLADLALSEFDHEFGSGTKPTNQNHPLRATQRGSEDSDELTDFVDTADWTSPRRSLPPMDLASSERHPNDDRARNRLASSKPPGAWLTGQIEVDSPTPVTPASSQRSNTKFETVSDGSTESFDRFPRLVP